MDEPQVTFSADGDADTTDVDPLSFTAGSNSKIKFIFTARGGTFFKDGEVSFELPDDWPKLTTEDGSETEAKVTATVPDVDATDVDTDTDDERDDVATDDIDFNGREIVVKVSALGRY